MSDKSEKINKVTSIEKASKKRSMELAHLANTIRGLSALSGGYDNQDTIHHIYEDFGYPEQVEFQSFWNMYRRFGVAKAVVDILVDLTWVDAPTIESDNEAFVTQFNEVQEQLKVWNRLRGLDRRQRVGRYAGLFIQVADGKKPSEPVGSLNGINSIVKLMPMYEGQLRVITTETDPMSRDFGDPSMYDFNGGATGDRDERNNTSFNIHPSRLIMAAEGADDGSIYGISSLESIYNDLMDLRKISGAGGEGFYQNTRSAPIFTADDDFSGEEDEEKLGEAIDDFLAKHRKRLVLKGIKAEFPNIQLSDPKDFYQNSINNISAGSNIPSAFLIGQQTGRLASDKDSRHLMTIAQSRRDNFLTIMVKGFINWLVDHNVIQGAEYEVTWGDLLTLSDMERVEVIAKMSESNERQFRSGGQPIFTPEEMRLRAGLSIEADDMPEEVEFEDPNEGMQDDGGDKGIEKKSEEPKKEAKKDKKDV